MRSDKAVNSPQVNKERTSLGLWKACAFFQHISGSSSYNIVLAKKSVCVYANSPLWPSILFSPSPHFKELFMISQQVIIIHHHLLKSYDEDDEEKRHILDDI